MATPGELCNKAAELLGLQANTTAIAWRALREDFQVTTGGRGKSAAHCTPSDAANLLIATIGKLPLNSYLKSWERFSRLTCAEAAEPLPHIQAVEEFGVFLKARHSFQEGLTALIASTTSGSLQKYLNETPHPGSIRVEFTGPLPHAAIVLSPYGEGDDEDEGLWVNYSDFTNEMSDVVLPEDSGDLEQSMNISGRTIIGLAELLRRKEAQG